MKYGHFGNLSTQYARARQGYLNEVLDALWSHFEAIPRPGILDVGCGTGIATRQMAARHGVITGSDVDPQMIAQTRSNEMPNANYVVASAERLPFPADHFDAVTAFSAFHWFAHHDPLHEMKRVLKEGGVVFIANKNNAEEFKSGYRKVLSRFIEGELPDAKKNYAPEKLLEEAGFREIESHHFLTTERHTLEQAVEYIQSISLWNLVPEERKPEAGAALRSFCRAQTSPDGFVDRKLEIVTLSGKK